MFVSEWMLFVCGLRGCSVCCCLVIDFFDSGLRLGMLLWLNFGNFFDIGGKFRV